MYCGFVSRRKTWKLEGCKQVEISLHKMRDLEAFKWEANIHQGKDGLGPKMVTDTLAASTCSFQWIDEPVELPSVWLTFTFLILPDFIEALWVMWPSSLSTQPYKNSSEAYSAPFRDPSDMIKIWRRQQQQSQPQPQPKPRMYGSWGRQHVTNHQNVRMLSPTTNCTNFFTLLDAW